MLIISSTGWYQRFAYWPVKLMSGRYVWLKQYYHRKYTGVNDDGFIIREEYADIFHVISNPDKSIFPL